MPSRGVEGTYMGSVVLAPWEREFHRLDTSSLLSTSWMTLAESVASSAFR